MKTRSVFRYIRAIPFAAIGFFVMLSVALFVGMSLVMFDAAMPSMWHYSSGVTAPSFFFFLQASCATFLLRLFGAAAYGVIGFLLFGVWLYWAVWNENVLFSQQWERLLSASTLPFFGAAFCRVYAIDLFTFARPGGYFGYAITHCVNGLLDMQAQQVVWFFCILLACVVLSRSWFYPVGTFVYHGLQYVLYPDGPLAKAFYGVLGAVQYVMTCALKSLRWVFDTITGAMVTNSQESIVVFEDEKQSDDEVYAIMQDVFWNSYLENKNAQSIKQFAKADSFDEVIEQSSNESEHKVVRSPGAKKTTLPEKKKRYAYPNLVDFAQAHAAAKKAISEEELIVTSETLEKKLQQFGITGKVVATHSGPVVTLFEYAPESNVKLSKIVGLQDDLAMALKAQSIRILAPIPGKAVVGFEVANPHRESVHFAHIEQAKTFKKATGQLPIILGEDTLGRQIVVDLATMPHLLVAGSTGSGKSVALNAILASLLCRFSPDDLKLVIVDPKRLEFAQYEDIAHLLVPIVTDPRKAVPVLKWVVHTMEARYELMATCGVRNITEYQQKQKNNTDLEPMPWIVVMIDELADLMMTAGKEVEELLARLAQMARAAGIHIIVATQRPSVDVITGMIKVNFTSRISFKVTSKVDSRTILDDVGAEQLLGKGDMLFLSPRSSHVQRVHGAYISDAEIDFIVQNIKAQRQPHYEDVNVLLVQKKIEDALPDGDEQLYQEIITFLQDIDEVSISMLQRQFRIGYNRSARIIAKLEADGIVMSSDGGKMRRVVKQ